MNVNLYLLWFNVLRNACSENKKILTNNLVRIWRKLLILVDGEWSLWSSWGGCSETCEKGHTQRYRYCTENKFGGKNCSGDSLQLQDCNDFPCPSKNVKVYKDTCILNGRLVCFDMKYSFILKLLFFILVDGVFNPWSNWTDCSTTCGTGIQSRNRTCDGPYHGGQECMGNYSDSQQCNTHHCPGEWNIIFSFKIDHFWKILTYISLTNDTS